MHTDAFIEKPTSIIFLDIDGVLIGDRGNSWLSDKIQNKVKELFIKKEGFNAGFTELEWRIAASHFFSPKAVDNLNKLIAKVNKMANVAIVISSQWRLDGTVPDLKDKMFVLYSFSRLIIDKTPDGKTWESKSRAEQIAFWLQENKEKLNIKSFVIFDDMDLGEGLSECFSSRFVLVENLLSEADIEKGYVMLTCFSDSLPLQGFSVKREQLEKVKTQLSLSLAQTSDIQIENETTLNVQKLSKKFPPIFPPNLHIWQKPYPIEEEGQLIEFLAERVSTIYASFLTLEGVKNRHPKVCFNFSLPEKFPPEGRVIQFKNNLKTFMIRELTKPSEYGNDVRLETDLAPHGILDEILAAQSISWKEYDLFKFFPEKGTIKIIKQNKKLTILITAREKF